MFSYVTARVSLVSYPRHLPRVARHALYPREQLGFGGRGQVRGSYGGVGLGEGKRTESFTTP